VILFENKRLPSVSWQVNLADYKEARGAICRRDYTVVEAALHCEETLDVDCGREQDDGGRVTEF